MCRWRFQGASGGQYLDASVLIFDDDCNFIEHVDYKQQTCSSLGGAIQHSGDKIDQNLGVGLHTVDIDLSSLPAGMCQALLWWPPQDVTKALAIVCKR